MTALAEGDYRFDCRWRTRGEIDLSGNTLQVRQGDARFFIRSADDAPRQLEFEPDGYRNVWDYPYGDGKTAVYLARKNLSLSRNSDWTFAHLMYAADDKASSAREISRVGKNLYLVRDGGRRELAGTKPEILAAAGIHTDSGFFFYDSAALLLTDATRLTFSDAQINLRSRCIWVSISEGDRDIDRSAGV